MAKVPARRVKEKCSAAKRFEGLLSNRGRTLAQVYSYLQANGAGEDVRNVRNFFTGETGSASTEVRGHLIAFARDELDKVLTEAFFEGVPGYLDLTEGFLARNQRYESIVATHCALYWLYSMETSDVELATRGQDIAIDKLRARAMNIEAEGGGCYGFEVGNVKGFALPASETIHLIGYETNADAASYMCLRADARRVGLETVSLYGFQAGTVRARDGVPMRGVARRVVLVTRDEDETTAPPLDAAAAAWLAAKSSRLGANAGFVVDLDGQRDDD